MKATKIDRTTVQLFSPFEREVGNPSRRTIHSLDDFVRFIERNNGVHDCFVSVYPKDGTIDKIWYELDGEGGDWVKAMPDTKKLYYHLTNSGQRVVPVVSGRKGFHLHHLLKPKKYPNAKELLTKVTYSILLEIFGDDKTKVCVDPHSIGDVRRICRIPNTLRPPENLNYCTYLPPDEFLDMSEKDIAWHMKQQHSYDYELNGNLPSLEDFKISDKINFEKFVPIGNATPIMPSSGSKFLKKVLRPCLYRNMMSSEPRHIVRVASTVDLLRNGLSVTTIFNAYSKLNWKDWNPETTKTQIESCRHLKPYGCRKLQRLGIPDVCCVG